VTLLVGDVSFMHDSNALLLLHDQHSIPPLCIVVVNNQGGGIFNFLPVAQARPSLSKKKKKRVCRAPAQSAHSRSSARRTTLSERVSIHG
jgi:2-succinyl-5-enolpyruvyl-6-hydroxy-3-cyclohexene-1-carboxylate synthase